MMRHPTLFVVLILIGSWVLSNRCACSEDLSQPSSSHASRKMAVNSIPLKELNREAQQKALSVLEHTSIYRRLPVNQFLCDPDMHTFLVRYPEVVVGIWRVMGVTQVDANRISDYKLNASDGMGTSSSIELLYGTKNLHIFYGQGVYEGSLFHNKLKGSCLLVLRSEFGSNRNGDPIVADRLDVFLRVDHIGVKILVKTLHALVGKTADINFVESTKFIGKISETAEINSSGLRRLADRIQQLDPQVRDAFQNLATNVNERAIFRLQTQLERSAPQPLEATYQPPIKRVSATKR
ncbi:MAG: hypothetical protein VX438_13410 [Planctomycetota bacterium]|nr:hypothetical protein [Planctomycetota bacterium]